VKAKKHKESREHKMVEDFNTDRDVFKGHSTSFMFEEDKEFAKVFDTTFESREDEEFDRLIDNPSTTGMTLSLTRSTGILPGNSSPMSSGRTRERDSSRKRSSRRYTPQPPSSSRKMTSFTYCSTTFPLNSMMMRGLLRHLTLPREPLSTSSRSRPASSSRTWTSRW
jgi:hypothetical protein